MATVTDSGAVTASTSNASTYASASFNPAADDLLVVLVTASTTVDAGDVTVSANGVTSMTRVDRSTSSTSIHSQYIFVADQLTTGTASMTVTFDCTGDAGTGAIVMVARVAGMTKTGATAIKQSTKLDNGAGSTTPEFTFAGACQTGNPTLVVLGQVSGAGSVEPTGWTEAVDTTYSTPTIGGAYVFRNSGFTGTTITWGDVETAHGGVAVELDASSSGVTGTASATFGFASTALGVPETFGVAAATLGFTATAQGIDRALGIAAGSFGFTATASGVAGTPPVEGQAVGSFGFTATASGVPRTPGQASTSLGGTFAASGVPRVQGVAAATLGGTFTAAGIDRALGTAAASLGFTATAAGVPDVQGVAAATFGFTGMASGTVGSAPVTGVAVALLGFTGAGAGVDRALGVGATSFGFTSTAVGIDRANGLAAASFGLTGSAAGLVRVNGVAAAVLGFTGAALGINFSIVTPAERTHTVGAESRATTVQAESRTVTVSAESRVTTVPATSRISEV